MTKNSNSVKIAVLITAAGSSTRMGGSIKKEYLPLRNGTVISNCANAFLKAFANNYKITNFVITCPDDSASLSACKMALSSSFELLPDGLDFSFTPGGSTRQKSVYNGLKFIKESDTNPDVVLIHDGARPFVTPQVIIDVLEAAVKYGAAVPGITPVDTQKEIDSEGFIKRHLIRKNLTAVQTPQGFDFNRLITAHQMAAEDSYEYTDDTEIWGKYCGEVKVTLGDSKNIKITYPQDLKISENFENAQEQNQNKENKMRIGLGYDLHRLVPGRKLILGGVELPFDKGEDGHSDGDVLFHAITDAVLGASGLGDIGSFFPPEDDKWKNADSAFLLKTVMEKVYAEGYKIINLDCVVKLEKPKFIPFRQQVIDSIAETLGINSSQVFVKAKTGEKLPPVGTSEAIEAEVVCLLEK